jgi:8-oxo-dGTP diphosphatase
MGNGGQRESHGKQNGTPVTGPKRDDGSPEGLRAESTAGSGAAASSAAASSAAASNAAASGAADAARPEIGKGVRYVVAALILRGSTVLICQRRGDQPMAHKWEFPGGKMEVGESAEQALSRELEEELSIQAEIGSRITRLRHTYRSGGAVDLQFFAVHRFAGELTNNIFQDMRWCELRDLPGFDFLAADRELIRDLAAGKLL